MNRRTTSIVLCFLSGLATAWCVFAGPMLPSEDRVPDEALSLAGLRQFKIEVSATPDVLARRGITTDKLKSMFHRRLENTGLMIREDGDVPRLVLTVFDATDIHQPESVALSVVIAVHHPVYLKRMKREMTVPTVSMGKMGLTTKQKADGALQELIWVTTDALNSAIRMATSGKTCATTC